MKSDEDSTVAGTDRREFLKLSTAGAVALSTLSAGAWVSGCSPDQVASGMRVLRPEDVVLLRALTPAVMKGQISGDDSAAIERAVQSFDTLLGDLSDAVVKLMRQAFDALSFPPSRALLAGQWSSWSGASVGDAEGALARLRDSRFAMLNAIHAAMIRMISSSWYLIPENARATGYPGPPQKLKGTATTLLDGVP